jgi:3-methyladenine DNA glycosylase AlkD
MTEIDKLVNEIKNELKNSAPVLTDDQKSRMYKILNSDNPDFVGYGNKHSDIEKKVREIHNKHQLTYQESSQIYRKLIVSNVHDDKVTGLFLLNRSKKDFNKTTVQMIYELIPENFDTWAITDTTMIRVLGPFLGKKGNDDLAKKTIEKWANSENLWIRRASMVILLKIIMVRKGVFISESFMFELAEKMLQYEEDYILKGVGWLLKTYSKYKPDVIIEYLNKNKKQLPRLVLRYASEKLAKETRAELLKK